jgi:23S rRNA pseudouridine1911/1915/1917 synthase
MHPIAPLFGQESAICQRWTVEAYLSGCRADVYLSEKIKCISRSRAKKLIQSGNFRLAGLPVRPARHLSQGMAVELWKHKPDDEDAFKTLNVEILYEDEHVLAINKPHGLVVHPTSRHLHNTLTAWLKTRYGADWPRPCHRLDANTSGVLIAAKSRSFQRHIKMAFAKGDVKKSYLAIAHGKFLSTLHVDTSLALQGERGLVRIRMIPDNEGQKSITDLCGLAYDPASDLSLIACYPKTGRQHQIRAHLASVGHPIAGDTLYGFGDAFFDEITKNPDIKLEINGQKIRHSLHATRIVFTFGSNEYNIHCPPKADFFKVTTMAKDDTLVSLDVAEALGSSYQNDP